MVKDQPILKEQSGQALIEFVLLLVVIFAISYGSISLINTRVANLWVEAVKSIVDDPNEKGKVRL